jgi:RND family efflux transporter MFP subunit|tara:strand:- start:1287 stop:2459 length:1173 start_codon:yes stop_codon:yes gene_type:complete
LPKAYKLSCFHNPADGFTKNFIMNLQSLPLILALSLSVASFEAIAAPKVTVVNVEKRPLERSSTQPASIEAFYEADLNAKVTGYVDAVLVDIGSKVKAGQPLFRISAPEMEQQVSGLKGQLAQYKNAQRAAEANLAAAESETKRIASLVAKGSLNQKVGQEFIQKLETARAGAASATGALSSAQAQLKEVQALVKYATIKAPFDGVVTYRTVDPGDLVYSANSSKGDDNPLMRVAQVSKLRAIAYFPESDALWLDVGDSAKLTFSSIPGKTFQGTIARTSGALEPSTRTMRAEVDIDNSNGGLLAGIYGEMKVALESQAQAMLLPAGSVRFDGPPHVYVLSNDNTVTKTEVTLGSDDGQWLQILSGLNGNERIVDNIIGRLQDGDSVVVR